MLLSVYASRMFWMFGRFWTRSVNLVKWFEVALGSRGHNMCERMPATIARGMRLGRDAIVLTQLDTTRSIGFLSQSLNEGKYNVETPIVSYCRQGSLMEVDTTVQISEVCYRAVILYDKTYILTSLHCPRGIVSNRVLRNYHKVIDNFIRVSFVDEGGEKLRSTDLSPRRSSANEEKKLTAIYIRILSILGSRIVIGDKKFEFLAFSSIQLKDNSAWMFASQNGEEIEVIHDVEIESDMNFVAHDLAALGSSTFGLYDVLGSFTFGLHDVNNFSEWVLPSVKTKRNGSSTFELAALGSSTFGLYDALGPFGLFTLFILGSFYVRSANEDISSRFIG
ncbi:hypothetical protein GIB67_041951 [Kingdonia uniflora]|uniref:RNA-dependent RNA polymerase n=1 Tax=Kingdonia uniflora TaxID=39325 RepID=A0A7J7P0C7_9MAGN|nr:hypothetical protein GIB67_041951 [Kingdonia uniflora]